MNFLDVSRPNGLRDAETRRERGARPIAVEWVFGTTTAPAVGIAVGDTSLSFRGKIDRVDRRDDGALDVVDYKTGKASSYGGIAADPVDGGRHLQLPIYSARGKAPRSTGTVSNPCGRVTGSSTNRAMRSRSSSTRARRPAPGRSSPCSPERSNRGVSRTGPAARRQDSFEHCSWCDFNTVCPAERDVLWQVARATPVLAGYVGLVEPETADE